MTERALLATIHRRPSAPSASTASPFQVPHPLQTPSPSLPPTVQDSVSCTVDLSVAICIPAALNTRQSVCCRFLFQPPSPVCSYTSTTSITGCRSCCMRHVMQCRALVERGTPPPSLVLRIAQLNLGCFVPNFHVTTHSSSSCLCFQNNASDKRTSRLSAQFAKHLVK